MSNKKLALLTIAWIICAFTVALGFIVLVIYNTTNTEISSSTYKDLGKIHLEHRGVPEWDAAILRAYSDEIVTFGEFIELQELHEQLQKDFQKKSMSENL